MSDAPESLNPDDSSLFHFVGDHPAVDFVNTVYRRDGVPFDALMDPAALGSWADKAGFRRDFDADLQDLDDARRLREAVRELLDAWREHRAPSADALAELNGVLAARPGTALEVAEDGTFEHRRDEPGASVSNLLQHLAGQTAALLTEGDRRRLKACRHEACVLLFWDTSRNLSRRWCNMATCGNRSKAARHYQKSRNASRDASA